MCPFKALRREPWLTHEKPRCMFGFQAKVIKYPSNKVSSL